MKWTLLCWWITPLCVTAQKTTITPGMFVTINTTQTILNLTNEGSVVLMGASSLTLTGVTSGTGRCSVDTQSSLTIASGGNGTMYFASEKHTLKYLFVFGSLRLGNPLSLSASNGVVKLRGGTLASDSFLTLHSRAWGTARIDSSLGLITGPVIVERYIPANRAWRFLAVPFVSSYQSINQAWQGGYTSTILTCPPQNSGTPGFDTHITYNGMNGYDLNTTQNPSLYIYQSNAWTPLSSVLATKITDYSGYALFVRGDRTICLTQATSATPVGTILRASGTVSIGPFSRVTNHLMGNYFLEGNPHASSIDLVPVTLRSGGITPEVFWIWDPGYGANGGYVAYNHGAITPSTPNYPNAASARIIESGQAYLLQATSATQTLQYEEADKVATNRSGVFGRPIAESATRVQLLSSSGGVLDGALVRQSEIVQYKSSPKIWNFSGPGVALYRPEQLFAIETRLPQERDTSFLFFRKLAQSTYVLELTHTGEDTARFVDRLLERHIELHDTLRYQFSVTDSLSFMNRFMIVYTGQKKEIPTIIRSGIYPNPVTDWLYFGDDLRGQKKVVDVLGRTHLTTSTQKVNCARLARGTYYVLVSGKTISFQKQ